MAVRTHQLETANRELESFSYSVSHDLRAPLRAIDGFSRMVLEDHATALTADGQRLLNVVRKNVQRMGQLIDDLLEFSRFSRRDLKCVQVDMDRLVRDLTEERRAAVSGALDIAIESLPPAWGDASLLRQVWANLLDNAIKFTRTRTPSLVWIGSRREAGVVVYFVRDNGVGFDVQYADKVFGVFQRLHRAEEFEGTGVGLATVQRVVHRHGGRVWAEAVVDAGATFYFALPEKGAPGGESPG